MKNIISALPARNDLYLTLVDEEGNISCANTHMLRNLDLRDPRSSPTNFFDLVHPGHISAFKKSVEQAEMGLTPASLELYLKNGSYHPMKWQVNYLGKNRELKKIFFCLGYKIIDDERLKKFNKLVEKYYPLVLEGLTGIIFHDKDGEIIAANQQTATIFNTTLERLYQLRDIGGLWQSKWNITGENGELVPFESSPFMKAIATKKPQKEEFCVRLRNGEQRWILFGSQPLPEDHREGNDCWAISNIIDITNEKLLDARVQVKEGIIDAFVRQTPNLAWVVDEDSTLLFASSAFYQNFGLDENSATGRKMSDLVPGFVFKALYEKHIEAIETGKPIKTVERVKLADGSNYVSHVSIFPIADVPGKRLVGGYAVNVPDSGQIETELRGANERLLNLNRAAMNAIWEWDMKTGTIYRNEALMEMIGYQRDESKGLSWWLRRIHPEDRNRVSDKVKETTETFQSSWQDEYRFKCADGTYKHIQDKGFVIYENGLPVKMIGSLQDISSVKELEDKLANEKLQRQKEISETVIKVQEKERTRLGHELHDNVNQILSTAKMFVDMLSISGKEQKQVKEKSLQYIAMAIEEIRKLSKELVVPQFKEQGLVNSIHSLIEDIHFTNAIRIKFTHDLDSDLLSSGKKITLFRIVQEQLKNILTHSKAKQAEILLRSRQHDVELVIKDNGIGFDTKQTHRGIGLSNIYERISFYNGTVDIQAAPGKGCTVVVRVERS